MIKEILIMLHAILGQSALAVICLTMGVISFVVAWSLCDTNKHDFETAENADYDPAYTRLPGYIAFLGFIKEVAICIAVAGVFAPVLWLIYQIALFTWVSLFTPIPVDR
jgi:hypothetical protein